MGLAFFTLPPNYSVQLHEEIWSLCQFGNGFNWKDVYFMPIHFRKFYLNKLIQLKQKEKEEHEKANPNSMAKMPKVRMK